MLVNCDLTVDVDVAVGIGFAVAAVVVVGVAHGVAVVVVSVIHQCILRLSMVHETLTIHCCYCLITIAFCAFVF